MGSSCPLLSSPTGNDPAFPKLALLAHSRAGGLGASFGSAITESLLPEKAIHLSRNTVPPGSNCYRLRRGKDFPIWKPPSIYNGHFFSKTWYCRRKNSENLSTLLSESALGFVPCFALSLYNGHSTIRPKIFSLISLRRLKRPAERAQKTAENFLRQLLRFIKKIRKLNIFRLKKPVLSCIIFK